MSRRYDDVRRVIALASLVFSAGVGAQAPATSPLQPVCADGATPKLQEAEYPVVLRAGTAWNRHEYSAEERTRILFHADAIRQHFTPPPSLGQVPVIAESWIPAWGGAPSLHSAVSAKLVLVMRPNGHVRTSIWQMAPFSLPLATAVMDAVAAADKAGDFEGIPRAGEARGDDTLVVQLRSVTAAPGSDELPLMRARLARYVADEPARITKAGGIYYPDGADYSNVENKGEIIALVGSNGKAVMSGTQVSRIEWRDFINTMRGAVESTVYQPARSGGCAVPSLFVHNFDFSVRR
ncbi:MAG: hypothetical protein V4813_09620 [Gemmatimonadota bacterium]